MNNNKIARLFGMAFILTFLSYGIGTSLIESVISVPDFLTNINANKIQIIIGVVLMAIVHTCANIALPILMLPILKPQCPHLAFGYQSFAIGATIILVVGTLFLLLLLPLSDAATVASFTITSNHEIIGIILKKAGFYSYHMGMALWSIGGLMFVSALYKLKLIPQAMSVWGIIGYFILLLGSVLEIFEHNDIIEIISVIPGGLFELSLSIWFIVKGFNSTNLKGHPLEKDNRLVSSSN